MKKKVDKRSKQCSTAVDVHRKMENSKTAKREFEEKYRGSRTMILPLKSWIDSVKVSNENGA